MGLIGRPRMYHLDRPATTAERQSRVREHYAAQMLALAERNASLEAKVKQKVYHDSKRDTWETPWHVFDAYNDEFCFTLDVCAEPHTTKCARFFTKEQDGLAQDWGHDICWMNPPYARDWRILYAWMQKAYTSSLAGATVVAFVASRTGTKWWHAWVLGKGDIRWRQGRTTFVGAKDPAGFNSVAVIYRPPGH